MLIGFLTEHYKCTSDEADDRVSNSMSCPISNIKIENRIGKDNICILRRGNP